MQPLKKERSKKIKPASKLVASEVRVFREQRIGLELVASEERVLQKNKAVLGAGSL
jgi:hypothetical protein